MSYKFNYNFIIPISMVDENMRRSYLNDAITKQKFFFRINFLLKDYKKKTWVGDNDLQGLDDSYFNKEADIENIQELTIEEILNGCEKFNFPGIIPVLYEYIDLHEAALHVTYYKNHIEFLRLRSKGILMTDAKYMRTFVQKHPKYKFDSVLNDVKLF
jgi:glutamate--cysteine ligase catalytic subunit